MVRKRSRPFLTFCSRRFRLQLGGTSAGESPTPTKTAPNALPAAGSQPIRSTACARSTSTSTALLASSASPARSIWLRWMRTLGCTSTTVPRRMGGKWVGFLYVYLSKYIYNIYIYNYTYIHTYMHTYIHTFIHSFIHSFIHTYIHTYIFTYLRIFTLHVSLSLRNPRPLDSLRLDARNSEYEKHIKTFVGQSFNPWPHMGSVTLSLDPLWASSGSQCSQTLALAGG